MKLAFLSNYFNHHQSELAASWNDLTREQFTFYETLAMREERKKLGYGIEKPPYVKTCLDADSQRTIVQEIETADAVIIGSAPEALIQKRQHDKKLVFRYSERLIRGRYPRHKWLYRLWAFHRRYGRFKNTYLLCSSAYTARDFAIHGCYRGKAFKWGYFPPCKRYDSLDTLMDAKERTTILWCGRFLDWKHADDVIAVAKRLKDEGLSFELRFIGTGEKEDALKAMTHHAELEDCVSFLGSMPPSDVRTHMERAGIYAFTSDFQEGWGAVLNEAMNSGCAVVASHAAGSVPFLVNNGQNGLIYESGNNEELYQALRRLLHDPAMQEHLGRQAYRTITEEWNAQVAATRLMDLTARLQKGEDIRGVYASGPCSVAKNLKNNWYRAKGESV